MKNKLRLKISTKTHALAYAKAGYPVFPLGQRSKKPLKGSHGFYDATADKETLHDDFGQNKNYNVAIRTGKISNTFAILVLDVDPGKGGFKSFEELEKQHGALPATHKVATSGGGFHLYLSYDPRSYNIKSTSSELALGLDIRAEGGYIVAPPSIHKSGKRYKWLEGHLTKAPPPPAPLWLLTCLKFKEARSSNGVDLKKLLSASIKEGTRNVMLPRLIGKLFSVDLDYETILIITGCINSAIVTPPLSEEQISKMVSNIARKEIAKRSN